LTFNAPALACGLDAGLPAISSDANWLTYKDKIKALRDKGTQVNNTRTTLTQLVNEANDQGKALRRLSARVRGGFKATFGPDSSQYEQSGGTRESEEKTPKPRGGKKDSKDSDAK
jgi:hypothetical protein